MSEIEKMYENAGFQKKRYCEWDKDKESCFHSGFVTCDKCTAKIERTYPPFTAEKQIELIKWISKNKNGFWGFYDTSYNAKEEKHYWCCADQYCEDFNYGYHEKEFDSALAGLINNLWQSLTEVEKQQIKEILE